MRVSVCFNKFAAVAMLRRHRTAFGPFLRTDQIRPCNNYKFDHGRITRRRDSNPTPIQQFENLFSVIYLQAEHRNRAVISFGEQRP